jgi:hypothetical protein
MFDGLHGHAVAGFFIGANIQWHCDVLCGLAIATAAAVVAAAAIVAAAASIAAATLQRRGFGLVFAGHRHSPWGW